MNCYSLLTIEQENMPPLKTYFEFILVTEHRFVILKIRINRDPLICRITFVNRTSRFSRSAWIAASWYLKDLPNLTNPE